ncbi:hypothetical protein BD311DRAFT_744079 [Dichomitus squalens]|uniref:Uncharacterized protein n=1 Tax=Dichomitus squalens TaxID=114155 RepID=A0A4Q9N4I6_9APHY|nr:hypothetical protein BD311DRAFT_744079 [Dichomitus squalens]
MLQSGCVQRSVGPPDESSTPRRVILDLAGPYVAHDWLSWRAGNAGRARQSMSKASAIAHSQRSRC